LNFSKKLVVKDLKTRLAKLILIEEKRRKQMKKEKRNGNEAAKFSQCPLLNETPRLRLR